MPHFPVNAIFLSIGLQSVKNARFLGSFFIDASISLTFLVYFFSSFPFCDAPLTRVVIKETFFLMNGLECWMLCAFCGEIAKSAGMLRWGFLAQEASKVLDFM